MAGPPGFEPGQTVLETGMLPLHHGPLFDFQISKCPDKISVMPINFNSL